MPAVLETGLDFIESDNETNLPCVKGYNIINGQLKVASDQKTFESINPANKNDCLGIFPLSTKQDIDDAIFSAKHNVDWIALSFVRSLSLIHI